MLLSFTKSLQAYNKDLITAEHRKLTTSHKRFVYHLFEAPRSLLLLKDHRAQGYLRSVAGAIIIVRSLTWFCCQEKVGSTIWSLRFEVNCCSWLFRLATVSSISHWYSQRKEEFFLASDETGRLTAVLLPSYQKQATSVITAQKRSSNLDDICIL